MSYPARQAWDGVGRVGCFSPCRAAPPSPSEPRTVNQLRATLLANESPAVLGGRQAVFCAIWMETEIANEPLTKGLCTRLRGKHGGLHASWWVLSEGGGSGGAVVTGSRAVEWSARLTVFVSEPQPCPSLKDPATGLTTGERNTGT